MLQPSFLCGDTYVSKLDDEVTSLVVRKHRQDIFSRFAVALPDQEISLLPKKFLGLGARNGTVIPLLFCQGALRSWDNLKELLAGGHQLTKLPLLWLGKYFTHIKHIINEQTLNHTYPFRGGGSQTGLHFSFKVQI